MSIFSNYVQRCLLGLGKFKISVTINAINQIFGSIAAALAALLHQSLGLMVFCQLGLPGLFSLLFFIYFFKRSLKFRIQKVSKYIFFDLVNNSRLYFFLQIFTVVSFQIDTFIIARYLDADQVAIFSVTWKLATFIMGIFTLILSPLWPILNEKIMNNESIKAAKLAMNKSMNAGRYSLLIATFVIIFGKKILYIWSGHLVICSSLTIFSLAIWIVLYNINIPFNSFLNAEHYEKFLLRAFGFGALCNIFFSILFTKFFSDPSGVIIGSGISLLFFNLLPGLRHVRSHLIKP
jgi:O-antigen/teichoic acid export membrane protein